MTHFPALTRYRSSGLILRSVRALLVVSAGWLAAGASQATWQSSRVAIGADGRLAYASDEHGNRIPDFSDAGYRGGGAKLPDVPAARTLAPAPGDNTARIQAALDAVGELPLSASGHRGALRLEAGVYEVTGSLHIAQSGVVLMGRGTGEDPARDTIIRRIGTSTAPVILAGGGADDAFRAEIPGTRSEITTVRVLVGERSFNVANSASFHMGDAVIVEHPSTEAWIEEVHRGDTATDAPWRPGEINIRYHRYVTAISGNTLTLDAPIFNHLDRSLATSVVFRYDDAAIVREIGIENLFIDIVTAGPESEDHAAIALHFVQAENCWARNVTARHFVHAGIQFGPSCTRSTAVDCRALEPHSIVTGGRRYNFGTEGAQLILFERCHASYARHAFITNGAALDSGIVFLECTQDHCLAATEGHRRWSQGLLFDGLRTTNPETEYILGLYNRGRFGTGHGWATVHSVAWHCDVAGRSLVVQQPPTAQNYAIGCFGTVGGEGPFVHPAGFVEGTSRPGLVPQSLYRVQLAERGRTSASADAPR